MNAPPIAALLFDLDDTLLDYSGGVDGSWAGACHACCPRAGVDPSVLLGALAETRRWFWDDAERHRRERVNMLGAWQHIVEFALERLGCATPDGFAAAVARDFAERRREVMRLFPDALDTLEHFRKQGVPLGLITNGDAGQQRDKIERHGLARFFDTILIEGEFGTGKPEEIVYRHALQALGASATTAWMVGDHLEWDVSAPQRLGDPARAVSPPLSGGRAKCRTSAGCLRRRPRHSPRGTRTRSPLRRRRLRASESGIRTSAHRGFPGSGQRRAHNQDNRRGRHTGCREGNPSPPDGENPHRLPFSI